MSKENAVRFLMRLEWDGDLKTRYLSAANKMQKIDDVEKGKLFEQEIQPIAREAGCDFSFDEWKEFQVSPQDGELSDDDLDKVVGGEGQLYTSVWLHCTKYEDPEYIRKSMKEYLTYKCPGYEYHPHFGMTYRCDSCKFGYFG